MSILADPATLAILVVAVVMLGMAKGGLAGVGALATPLAALVLPPATAAALLLPVLIVQDVISVWSFRKTWDGWIIAWMRSEEHTSELQSLMRSSYAVFC